MMGRRLELGGWERGIRVVDVVSGRQGEVQGVSRSHCKVRFEFPKDMWLELRQHPPLEIVPLERLQIWSPTWECRGLGSELLLPPKLIPVTHAALGGGTAAALLSPQGGRAPLYP